MNRAIKKYSIVISLCVLLISLGGILLFVSYADSKQLLSNVGEYVYKIGTNDLKVIVKKQDEETDLEGRLKKAYKFYFLKFKYNNNFFSINIPDFVYENTGKEQKEELLKYILSTYDKAFETANDIFLSFPRDYRFNITFGETTTGDAFNRVYSRSKNSNIFVDAIPFTHEGVIFDPRQKRIFIHEIAHSFFGIFIGNIRDPRFKAFEEGFCDYFAELLDGEIEIPDIVITEVQFNNMNGLTQFDLDSSIWGKDILKGALTVKGYGGVTHHLFGLQFIYAFIDIFGASDLPEFLKRVKAKEDVPYGEDFGTGHVLRIFELMGYNDEQVDEFRKRLHANLGKNIFNMEFKE